MKKLFGIYSVAFMKTNGSIRIIHVCCTGLWQRGINTYRTELCRIKGSGLVCIQYTGSLINFGHYRIVAFIGVPVEEMETAYM